MTEQNEPCAAERDALAEAEVALADAERVLSDAIAREGDALATYDAVGHDADLEALHKAKLRRERLARIRDRAAETVDSARKALRAAERADDEQAIAAATEVLRPDALLRAHLPVFTRVLEHYRALAEEIASLRILVCEAADTHDEARRLAAKLDDRIFAEAVPAPRLDDAAFALGILIERRCAAEGLAPDVSDFLQAIAKPEWGHADRARYEAALAMLAQLGALPQTHDEEHDGSHTHH